MAELIKVEKDFFEQFFKSKSYKTTKIQRIIEQFELSDEVVAEIAWKPGEYANASSLQSILKRRLDKMKKDYIVKSIKGRVFIFKKEALDEQP